MSNINVYEIITERILKELESGTAPWRQPWRTTAPANMASKKPYRGINTWLLSTTRYTSPFWGTFDQAKQAGGSIRKGEKASLVIFYRQYARDTKPGDGGTIRELENGRRIKDTWILRYYHVFNIDQMDLPDVIRAKFEPQARTVPPLEAAENIIHRIPNPPALRFGGNQAAYFPITDTVMMPDRVRFESTEAYYATLFHEEIHATGHASRLNRPGITDTAAFGSETYSKEELVAEMGAAFLCGKVGIEQRTLPNNAAYLRNWSERLRADSRLIVTAASAAQKAADHILGEAAPESRE